MFFCLDVFLFFVIFLFYVYGIFVCYYLLKAIAMTSKISNIRMAGNPITNLAFFVLCLNRYIPAIPPSPPPKKTNINKVFSDILLHFPYYFGRNVLEVRIQG